MKMDWRGYWDNQMGYDLTPVPNTDYFEFRAKAKCLTWVCFCGLYIQPDHHFFTDLGSVPKPLQIFPALRPTRFPRAYIMHDSGYKHGGLWIGQKEGALRSIRYEFAKVPREDVDCLLWEQLEADGANILARSIIYAGVRIGGKPAYNKKLNVFKG